MSRYLARCLIILAKSEITVYVVFCFEAAAPAAAVRKSREKREARHYDVERADYENPIRNSEFGLPGNFVIRPNPDTMEHVRGTRLTRAVAVAHAPI